MALSYFEQLRHPNWQRKRLEVMQRDGFKCQYCRDGERTLNVHHKHYTKGRLAWEYSEDELVTLCESCHELSHEEDSAWKQLLAKLSLDGPFSKPMAFSLVCGWASKMHGISDDEYRKSPFMFVIGQIAAELDHCSYDELEQLLSDLKAKK